MEGKSLSENGMKIRSMELVRMSVAILTVGGGSTKIIVEKVTSLTKTNVDQSNIFSSRMIAPTVT
jgi:hypothetical protein